MGPPTPKMRDFQVMETVEDMRVLGDETRLSILALLTRGASTGAKLARILGIPANRAHYHLQKLLGSGLILEVGRGQKRWKEERYYAAAARHVVIDPRLPAGESPSTRALRQSIDTTFLDWRRDHVLAIGWGQLARFVVEESLRVRSDDRVLVFFGPFVLELAEAILIEIEAAGALAFAKPWSRNVILRTLDRHDPEELSRLSFVPDAIDQQLTAAVLVTTSLVQGPPPNDAQRKKLPILLESLSKWQRSARARRLRYLEVALPHRGEFQEATMTVEEAIDAFWSCATADHRALRESGARVLARIKDAPQLTIRGPDGSELRFRALQGSGHISDALISDADIADGYSCDAIPAGRVSVLPERGSASGTFRADYTFSGGLHMKGVRLTVREGRIVEIDAGEHTSAIKNQIASAAGEADRLAVIGVGINPARGGLTGKPSLDACLAGTITLGFGNNEELGGDVGSTLTLQLPAGGCTLLAGESPLVVEGRLVGAT